jgi:hypothetical protein
VTNGIPRPLFLPVHTVNCVQTLKVTLLRADGSEIHKTGVVYRTNNPTWKGFDLPLEAFGSEGYVIANMYDWDRFSGDDFIGTCTINREDVCPGAEMEWTLVNPSKLEDGETPQRGYVSSGTLTMLADPHSVRLHQMRLEDALERQAGIKKRIRRSLSSTASPTSTNPDTHVRIHITEHHHETFFENLGHRSHYWAAEALFGRDWRRHLARAAHCTIDVEDDFQDSRVLIGHFVRFRSVGQGEVVRELATTLWNLIKDQSDLQDVGHTEIQARASVLAWITNLSGNHGAICAELIQSMIDFANQRGGHSLEFVFPEGADRTHAEFVRLFEAKLAETEKPENTHKSARKRTDTTRRKRTGSSSDSNYKGDRGSGHSGGFSRKQSQDGNSYWVSTDRSSDVNADRGLSDMVGSSMVARDIAEARGSEHQKPGRPSMDHPQHKYPTQNITQALLNIGGFSGSAPKHSIVSTDPSAEAFLGAHGLQDYSGEIGTLSLELGTVLIFRQDFALDDAIESHACSLEANVRATNGIPLGSPLPLTVAIMNYVETLKAHTSCLGIPMDSIF